MFLIINKLILEYLYTMKNFQGKVIVKISIRKAIEDDYYDICELVYEIHSLHVRNRGDIFKECDEPLKYDRFDEIIKDNYNQIYVAINQETKEIVGYSLIKVMNLTSFITINKKCFVYIEDFCIKSNYQRKGIGKKLFNYILNYSKKIGATTIELSVWDFNKKAIEFYKSLGMTTRNIRMELNIK